MNQLSEEYLTYINSPEWDDKRRQRLRIDGYTCQGCGMKDQPLDVHHLSYDRFGDERMDDLLSLCRRCHQIEHGERPSIIFDTCRTCGEWLAVFVQKVSVLGTAWTRYTCQDGHVRLYRDK